MGTETERFEAQGSNALATLKAALSGFDFEESEVVRAAVEVDIETPEPESNGDTSNGSNGGDRQLQKARPDTQIHYALAFLAAAEEPLTPGEAADDGELDKQQFSSAFSRGYNRMLLDREPMDGQYGFRYYVNQHGLAELERLGEPNLDAE